LFGHAGCYRAVIDIADSDAGSAAGAAGEAGVLCDATPLSNSDLACRGLLPNKEQCSVQDPNGWNGCYDGGCGVCADVLQEFPFYFNWHPCCQANDKCTSDIRVKCNERCPPPVPRDRITPCWFERPNL
jgi:hypothetical protein